MTNIAIFASGTGTNADNICRYFDDHISIKIRLIVSDRIAAGVFEVAKKHKVESLYLNNKTWENQDALLQKLKEKNIDFIVLAGFLKLIPIELIHAFDKKIINIHPALLPEYGGKGMFGMHVHDAVFKAKEKVTGISIHFVNEHYDEGDIIFQVKTNINPNDSPEQIAALVHRLEMNHFPQIIEAVVLNHY